MATLPAKTLTCPLAPLPVRWRPYLSAGAPPISRGSARPPRATLQVSTGKTRRVTIYFLGKSRGALADREGHLRIGNGYRPHTGSVPDQHNTRVLNSNARLAIVQAFPERVERRGAHWVAGGLCNITGPASPAFTPGGTNPHGTSGSPPRGPAARARCGARGTPRAWLACSTLCASRPARGRRCTNPRRPPPLRRGTTRSARCLPRRTTACSCTASSRKHASISCERFRASFASLSGRTSPEARSRRRACAFAPRLRRPRRLCTCRRWGNLGASTCCNKAPGTCG